MFPLGILLQIILVISFQRYYHYANNAIYSASINAVNELVHVIPPSDAPCVVCMHVVLLLLTLSMNPFIVSSGIRATRHIYLNNVIFHNMRFNCVGRIFG